MDYKNDQLDDDVLTSSSDEDVMEDDKEEDIDIAIDDKEEEEKDACTVRRCIEDYLELRRMRDEQGEFDDFDLVEDY